MGLKKTAVRHCEWEKEEEDDDDDEDGARTLSGHFAPVWAALTCAMGVMRREPAYTILLNHVKAVMSAEVWASVLGPYAAQVLLASGWLRGLIERAMAGNWDVGVEDAGQGVSMCDLWVGKHELLYSMIFSS